MALQVTIQTYRFWLLFAILQQVPAQAFPPLGSPPDSQVGRDPQPPGIPSVRICDMQGCIHVSGYLWVCLLQGALRPNMVRWEKREYLPDSPHKP